MAFLGIFGGRDLKSVKVAEVKSDLQKVEMQEGRLRREASGLHERKESKWLYAENEPHLTGDEKRGLALDIAELDRDIAAKNDQLMRVRDQKRTLKGLLIVLEQQKSGEGLKVLDLLSKMPPEKLEESLQELADRDAKSTVNLGMVYDVLGAPLTAKGGNERLTPEERRILDEIETKRGDR